MGIGILSGDLSWVSTPEGMIMTIGAPFFVATFIFMGRRVAEQRYKTGVVVTVLGLLGVPFLVFVSRVRVLASVLVDLGADPSLINAAMESGSAWYIPLLLFILGQFIAWIIAEIVVIRTHLAIALILGVPSLITAQAFYFHLEVFWPLATGL